MATISPDVMTCQGLPDTGKEAGMQQLVAVLARDKELARIISVSLMRDGGFTSTEIITPIAESSATFPTDARVVYLPDLRDGGMVPGLDEADVLFKECAAARVRHFILVSSALVYDASFRNPGLMVESNPLPKDSKGALIASRWRKLEITAKRYFNNERLTILRCVTLLSQESANCIVRSLKHRVTFTLAGHDPSLQLLSPSDLANAIECVLKNHATGIFNVAPDVVVPFRHALKQVGTRRVPIPGAFLALTNVLRGRSACGHLDFKRYSWTVSNEKIKAIGFRPQWTSAGALSEFCLESGVPNGSKHSGDIQQFDDFGMDPNYIAAYGRTLFRFLSDRYWRIEVRGIENIPAHGRAVLAGTHRGFMPWDGVMALDLIVKRVGRYPRFLIHPGLVKFPFLANFMTKLGGIIACQENAKRVLDSDELLGVFPEGIQGAFVKYKLAYQIQDFHRDVFVKMALRHRAPIIPFVTVGSAEIFPILAKLKSRLWTKYSDWPEFPITPTFPLIPLPLPSKWHTNFLPALHIENDYPPSAAADASVIRTISSEVRNRMQEALDEMLQRRHSIFFGSVFQADPE